MCHVFVTRITKRITSVERQPDFSTQFQTGPDHSAPCPQTPPRGRQSPSLIESRVTEQSRYEHIRSHCYLLILILHHGNPNLPSRPSIPGTSLSNLNENVSENEITSRLYTCIQYIFKFLFIYHCSLFQFAFNCSACVFLWKCTPMQHVQKACCLCVTHVSMRCGYEITRLSLWVILVGQVSLTTIELQS